MVDKKVKLARVSNQLATGALGALLKKTYAVVYFSGA
jgi:hypothetical protein